MQTRCRGGAFAEFERAVTCPASHAVDDFRDSVGAVVPRNGELKARVAGLSRSQLLGSSRARGGFEARARLLP